MIIVMKSKSGLKDIQEIVDYIGTFGVSTHLIQGNQQCVIGLVGDTTVIDKDYLETNPHVERVMKVQQPYKLANKAFHPGSTVIDVNGRKIGGGNLAIIAGPCSVESEEQIISVARSVKTSGASFLRGGAFKPRTSPYSFQGMGLEGLELLKLARKETGLPIVTEIMSTDVLDRFAEDVDIIQVGARNMQNFDLLKELGKTNKPILLKRGMSATIEELLMSAEYIMAGGNERVILCERGIRTFESYTRNTLDLSIIPAIKHLSHLPVIIDPSHATGLAWMVPPLSRASVAAGADGLIIEVHNDPQHAKCDGPQSLRPEEFRELVRELELISQSLKDVI